jgi:hypothetical protein
MFTRRTAEAKRVSNLELQAAGWRKADEQLDTPAEMGFAEATEHPLAEIRSVAIPACVEQCSHGSH